jgi:hypothetical protein
MIKIKIKNKIRSAHRSPLCASAAQRTGRPLLSVPLDAKKSLHFLPFARTRVSRQHHTANPCASVTPPDVLS